MKPNLLSYYIMPFYGSNLDSIFEKHQFKFEAKTIYQIGIQILEIFEKIHYSGFTYNDLKLDNIMIGDQFNSISSLKEIRLVDFGFAAKYRDESQQHLPQENTEVFRGNLIFATPSQFEFKSTSRKDDILSLCYMLVYLFHGGDV